MRYIKNRKYAPLVRPASSTLSTATLAAGIALALPVVAAQAQESRNVKTLGRIQVQDNANSNVNTTAVESPKFTQPLSDTPQTIQVITRELFSQQGATTLSEALRNSPAVGTFYAGENGNTSTGDTIYMRGFDTSSSIFVDGVRDLGSISRDLFNVEAVEVEKGPAGTDNGRSAPTGAINMVSKQASLEDAVTWSASAGSDGQKRTTADWNQRFGESGSALRLNAMLQDSDVPGRDHVKDKRWGVAPSLGFGLDTATRVYLNLYYVKQENIPDGFVPTIGLPGWEPQPGLEQLVDHPVDPENFYGTRDDHDDVTAQMATLRFEHDFSDAVQLSNIVRWGQTEQDYLLSSFMSTGGTAANPMGGNIKWTDIDDLSTYTLARSNNTFKDQQNRILTDQLNLRVDFATGAVQHTLSTGLELTREEQVNHNITATGSRPAANLYDPDWNDTGTLDWARNGTGSNGQTDTASLYVFDTLKFGERFLVTAGLRADRYETEFNSSAICNNGTGRGAVACGSAPVGSAVVTADLDDRDTLFNWKLGAVYKPVEVLSLYANYALSQQPPGGANFQLSAATGNVNGVNSDPQKAETVEVGAKWNVLDEKLGLNLALFQTDVTNEINNQILDDNGNPTQTGEKKVKGVELSAVGNITENWSVSAGYSHLDTEVVEGPNVAADGTPNLTYTPGDSFTAWTSYRLPFGLTVGGGLRHVGGLHRGTDGAVGTPPTTESYDVLDAVISYDATRQVSLRLNAYNLADESYVASINKSGYRYLPGTPRTFLFSADVRF